MPNDHQDIRKRFSGVFAFMDIISFSNEINSRIPLSYRAGWDNDGLMCAPEPDREIRRVLCALDVTEEVIDHAVSGGFDLILSHHPFIFHPIKSLNSAEGEGRMIGKLFSSGIGVISCHTRLDAVPGGVADGLCSLIGLSDIRTVAEGGEGDNERYCRLLPRCFRRICPLRYQYRTYAFRYRHNVSFCTPGSFPGI